MGDEAKQEIDRVTRLLARAKVKRTSIITQIRSIHDLGVRVASEPNVGSAFSVIAADLDSLWTQFKTEDDGVLDYLVILDKLDDYSPDAIAEVRRLITDLKAVANSLIPKGVEAKYLWNINKDR
ncbi:Integrase catalytic domain-containing protein [Aphis craccivora]|uniref:Integrase catalytic domain-containing protein n=1 Tax=Aphis craccivora TaxID=307492 RepID=A0A6G0VNG1_APHCR|nr:Integrase catalytic domain-containing protein [Aphis craccivora]